MLLTLLGWRQPYPHEARNGAAGCAIGALIVFGLLCYPEVCRNLYFLPAQCEPFFEGVLRPEIRPYRHCYESCSGCYESWSHTSCSFKLGMHSAVNEYDMKAAWYIAGSCGGSSCCAHEVCNKCTKHEQRCSRRSLFSRETLWVSADDANADRTTWAAAVRRRLEDPLTSCTTVSTTYDCNCLCARRVLSSACSIRCLPYWRGFVPVRVTVPSAVAGFAADDDATASAAALGAYEGLLSANQTSGAYVAAHRADAVLNRSDAAESLERMDGMDSNRPVYSPPRYEGATFAAHVAAGASRVVTVVYEHGASRRAALANLERPELVPGAVSECFYDPHVSARALLVPSARLAFASEMGYTLGYWALLVAMLVLSAVGGGLVVRPALLGGERVVAVFTELHEDGVVRAQSSWPEAAWQVQS